MMYALVDCDNCYVSYERVFDPATGKAITFRNSILHDRRSPFYTTDIKDVIKVK